MCLLHIMLQPHQSSSRNVPDTRGAHPWKGVVHTLESQGAGHVVPAAEVEAVRALVDLGVVPLVARVGL